METEDKEKIREMLSDYKLVLKHTQKELRELLDLSIKVKREENPWGYFCKHVSPDRAKKGLRYDIEYYKKRIKELSEKLKKLEEQGNEE